MKKKPKILIVDDNSSRLKLLTAIFEKKFELESVETGKETLERVFQFHPDIIILDYRLADVDGYEICRQIRCERSLTEVKIVLISPKKTLKDRLSAFEAGADDYLIEPFIRHDLLTKVNVFSRLIAAEQDRKTYKKRLQTANKKLRVLSETSQLVGTVADSAKKLAKATSTSLDESVIPVLKARLNQSEDWVMNLMNSVLELHTQAERCTQFLESLLTIHRGNERIEPVSAVEIVQQAIGLMSCNLSQEGIQWTLEFEQGRKMMVMGNSQLLRVFVILITITCDTLKKRKIVKHGISLSIKEKDDEFIQINVQDNSPDTRSEILESSGKKNSFSRKEGVLDSGVSEAIRIIKNCKGVMDIKDDLGGGVRFTVGLPKAAEEKQTTTALDGIDLF